LIRWQVSNNNSFHYLCILMSTKEIEEFNAILIKKANSTVSKEEAEIRLKELGILTKNGRISKRFKGLTRNVQK